MSNREREIYEPVKRYEASKEQGNNCYLDVEEAIDIANYYTNNHWLEDALLLLDEALQMHPFDTSLLIEKVYTLLDLLRNPEAKELANTITEDNDQVKILRFALLLSEQKVSEAEAVLDTLQDKQDINNVVEVTYSYLDTGYFAEALTYLNSMKEHLPTSDEMFMAVYADTLTDNEQYDEAAIYYNKLIDLNPYCSGYWYSLGRVYVRQTKYDQAIDALDFALICNDEHVDAYTLRGMCYADLDNRQRAIADFKKAQELGFLPSYYIDAYEGLDAANHGDWEKGIKHLEQVIKLAPIDPEDFITFANYYCFAALCLANLGKDREKAEEYVERAVSLGTGDLTILLNVGRIYALYGDVEKAALYWTQALDVDSGENTWLTLGEWGLEFNLFDFAQRCFENILEADPKNIEAQMGMLTLAMIHRDTEMLKRHYPHTGLHISDEQMKQILVMMQDKDGYSGEQVVMLVQKMLAQRNNNNQ